MDYSKISVGKHPPQDVNVIIEIPAGGAPIKYEFDKSSGAIFVDRFLHTAMHYPSNYGFIPNTWSKDGDPIDALVIANLPIMSGAVIRSRPIGVLLMEDEAGEDEKILMVPISKIDPYHTETKDYLDLPQNLCKQIEHFFAHYKDLEQNKWVKIQGWGGVKQAEQLIEQAIQNAK